MKNYCKSIVTLLITVFWAVSTASACPPCIHLYSPCDAYDHAGAVFIGAVLSVIPTYDDHPPGNGDGTIKRTIRFSIERAFKGIEGQETDVVLNTDSCEHLIFITGKKYLVYANKRADAFTLNSCSRTGEITSKGSDLAYIESLNVERLKPMIIGDVYGDRAQPISGINIVIEGKGTKYSTATGGDGSFKVYVEDAGKYKVSIIHPAEYKVLRTWPKAAEINQAGEKGEVSYEIEVTKNGCAYWGANLTASDHE